MAKEFQTEREGQISFFQDLRIENEVELSNNTDGVYRGTLFEFKLNISDINKVLFQTIKYLSHLRIKGRSIPKNILLVSLNTEIAYLFDSNNFIQDIEQIYNGPASRYNDKFDTKIKPQTIKYDNLEGLSQLVKIFDTDEFVKIHIDVFCVVGWAERYYNENPKATKIEMFKELRNPKHFQEFIYPWSGNPQDFKYIMDCLNDKMHKKELGAFYTPPEYCKKSTELVRKAISQIPKENDYVILDRCAGTGNLQEFLTDKNVEEITVGELDKYLTNEFKINYLRDKSNVIQTFYSEKDFNKITLGELEKFKTSIDIRNYLFDNELSHTIVNTYELKEWIVLNERIGDKVKMIIPPPNEVRNIDSVVNGGNALSENFVMGNRTTLFDMSVEYYNAIGELQDYVENPKINIIIYENPPYRDSSASNTDNEKTKSNKGKFVYEEMKGELKKFSNSNISTARDISNQFIWSAWKYYLKKENDCYVLFSPIKYWKSIGLSNKKFIKGFLFNRKHFHASSSSISCILWQNIDESIEEINLTTLDIDTKSNNEIIKLPDTNVKKAYSTLTAYFDKRSFESDKPDSIYLNPSGDEVFRKTSTTSYWNENIIGYMFAGGFSVDAKHITLVRTTIFNGRGFYLRTDNFLKMLPLFCSKLYPQKNWYERDVYFTTSDGGNRYESDDDFLKSCLIFTCLSMRNHCLSLHGSDNRFYKNELCFDTQTVASNRLKKYELNEDEQDLLETFKEILSLAKTTENYNEEFKYGLYQIDYQLNTRYKDSFENTIYDYPALNTKIVALKSKLSTYYEEYIQLKLFEYELLK